MLNQYCYYTRKCNESLLIFFGMFWLNRVFLPHTQTLVRSLATPPSDDFEGPVQQRKQPRLWETQRCDNLKSSLVPLEMCVTFPLPHFGRHRGGLVTTERRLDPPPHQEVRSAQPLVLLSNPGLVGREESLGPLPNLLHLFPVKASQTHLPQQSRRGQTRITTEHPSGKISLFQFGRFSFQAPIYIFCSSLTRMPVTIWTRIPTIKFWRCWYWPVLRLNQGVSDVGDGQVGLQVLVLLAGLTVAPQHIWTPTALGGNHLSVDDTDRNRKSPRPHLTKPMSRTVYLKYYTWDVMSVLSATLRRSGVMWHEEMSE